MNKAKDSEVFGGAWLDVLGEEDLAFVKRFVLASGSLKEVAQVYGVSYPTVRARLDRLIARVEVADRHADATAYERLLRGTYVDGKLDLATFKELLEAYRKERKEDG